MLISSFFQRSLWPFYILLVAFLLPIPVPAVALSLPEIEAPSQAYLGSLKARYGARTEDPRRAVDNLSGALRSTPA